MSAIAPVVAEDEVKLKPKLEKHQQLERVKRSMMLDYMSGIRKS
jgi:hypothetical protein